MIDTTLNLHALEKADPTVAGLILKEYRRQSDTLELIPSENLASAPILEALGTLLTNKYAEGYPGKRYYGGCEVMDEIETLAQAIPLKRLADPEDVAYAMLFLASDEATYITGQTLVVDGGQILPESKLALS